MKLHSKIYGDKGQDLIVIHGLFGMSDNWNALGKKFSKYCKVHLIDLRNHGRSPHSSDFDYDVMCEDVLEYMEGHNIQKPILLGHSLGGKVAMKCAFTYPEKIDKLIVDDIAPREYDIEFIKDVVLSLYKIRLECFSKRADVDKEISLFIGDDFTKLFILKNLYKNKDKVFAWRFNIDVFVEKIKNIQNANFVNGICTLPTYFIRGENSNYINSDDESLIQKYFSDVSISTIKDAGHFLHAEKPEHFYDEVMGFCLLG
jgi:pimeloyl-ACP methyl ester carboxylesterase